MWHLLVDHHPLTFAAFLPRLGHPGHQTTDHRCLPAVLQLLLLQVRTLLYKQVEA